MGCGVSPLAAEGIAIVPLAVDTFGGWHGAALDFLSKLGRQVARQVGKEEEDGVRQLRQRVSVLLTRDNVAMMGSRSPDIPPACIDGDIDLDNRHLISPFVCDLSSTTINVASYL